MDTEMSQCCKQDMEVLQTTPISSLKVANILGNYYSYYFDISEGDHFLKHIYSIKPSTLLIFISDESKFQMDNIPSLLRSI